MKAIMISIKPKWCAKIMNGEKTVEVRKNKSLANAIQKNIDENGYADIYVYCSKDGYNRLHELYDHSTDETLGHSTPYYEINNVRGWKIAPEPLNGKVVFKFRCYKVDRIWKTTTFVWCCESEMSNKLYEGSCLDDRELDRYFKPKKLGFNYTYGYAIHISNLEIFDKPKELIEFDLKKAPQNFCYVEVE